MKSLSPLSAAAAAVALAFPVAAEAGALVLTPASGAEGARLTLDAESEPGLHYRFTCAAGRLTAAQTGVTELLDIKAGQKVPDTGPSRVMPEGSALMGLATDKSKVKFVPAEASPNPTRGWDLSIALPLDDPSLKALAKGNAFTLFTTGVTIMVPLDRDDKATFAAFLKACGGA